MLWQCGQIIDGVQEFCDACWECSSRCTQCDEWFNKDQVGPLGLCILCEEEEMHSMACYDCDHEWRIYGFSVLCPHCESLNIVVSKPDDFFYQNLVEQKQIAYVKKLQARQNSKNVGGQAESMQTMRAIEVSKREGGTVRQAKRKSRVYRSV